ncbi:MAG: dTDP-4-dehydrorhamnose reductase [Bellilinea sp.]
MRILLFGKNGQLGWELNRSLITLGDLTVIDYPNVDFNQPQALPDIVRAARPDVIINAVAYTNVDKAESEPDVARRVNADAVAEMAREAKKLDALLVHFSTDYVFDGTKGEPYVETDTPNPLNVYGKTKLAGEEAAALAGKYLIFRTSWVYSNRTGGFVSKVLEWAKTQTELRIVDDQIGSPTWSRMLAEVTSQLLARYGMDPSWVLERQGLYHLAGAGAVSRYDWVKEILKAVGRDDVMVVPAKTAEFPTPAVRPLFSALDCSMFSARFGIGLPDWRTTAGFVMEGITSPNQAAIKKPPAGNFEQAVKDYLEPYENNFNYEIMLHGHLDASRFSPWMKQVNTYKPIKGSRILSSGCGSGGDLYEFSKRSAKEIIGVEVDFQLARLAKLRLKQENPSIPSLLVDYAGSALPLKSGAVDIVLSLHVLEHTTNPLLYLQESTRILSPNGILFLDIPNRCFVFEQHTNLLLVHWFPMRLRNSLIKILLFLIPTSKVDLRYKLSTLINFYFLSPGQIIRIIQGMDDIEVIDSYLHSYSGSKAAFPRDFIKLLFGSLIGMTTYRLVVRKKASA